MSAPDARGFVHRFEPAREAGAPTLLLLHGTGGDERDLLPIGRMLWPGAALLAPRGQVVENGMPRFFRRLAEGVFDVPDLKLRTDQLATFVAASAREYGFDPARLIAVGYSNGANIASSLLLLHPGLLRGAMLFRPMVPFQPARAPDLSGTIVYLSAGRQDPVVPKDQPARLATLLRQAGADVMLVWQSESHALGRTELEDARRWLTRLPRPAAGAG